AVFNGTDVTVGFPNGGRVDERGDGLSSAGFPVRVEPGGQVRLRRASDGRVVLAQLTAARPTVAPTTTTRATTTTTARAATSNGGRSATGRPLLPPPTSTTTTTRATRAASPDTPGPPATARTIALTPADGGTVTVVDRQRTYRGFVDVVPDGDGFRLV